MQSTSLTSILEFYRLTLPTLDNHCILKVSAFECKKALQESKEEQPQENEKKGRNIKADNYVVQFLSIREN